MNGAQCSKKAYSAAASSQTLRKVQKNPLERAATKIKAADLSRATTVQNKGPRGSAEVVRRRPTSLAVLLRATTTIRRALDKLKCLEYHVTFSSKTVFFIFD